MKTTALTIALGALLWAPAAHAYTIATGVSESCHERMTVTAYYTTEWDEELLTLDAPIPPTDIWREVSEFLEEFNDVEFESDHHRLTVTSLSLGVRAPDTEGHSVTNLASLRDAHTNPSGQYPHFLRGTLDDNDEGNEKAVKGSAKFLRDTVQIGLAYTQFPIREQIIETEVYVDFYGRIKVAVWAPAFYLGVAIHTLQDSFAHTIRSDDLMRVRHVMNFIDAINLGHNPAKDGLAHSGAMDDCNDEAKEISEVAVQATRELMLAAIIAANENNLDAVDDFIEKWMQVESGCNADNDYCDSKWLHIAKKEPTGPFMESILDCTLAPTHRNPDPTTPAVFLLVVAFVAVLRRR